MMHETKITHNPHNCELKGKETFDFQSKRIQMKYDDTLRSHFIRAADGSTLQHYDMCFTCSDLIVDAMDLHAIEQGNPTSTERADHIQEVKERMLEENKKRREQEIIDKATK